MGKDAWNGGRGGGAEYVHVARNLEGSVCGHGNGGLGQGREEEGEGVQSRRVGIRGNCRDENSGWRVRVGGSHVFVLTETWFTLPLPKYGRESLISLAVREGVFGYLRLHLPL